MHAIVLVGGFGTRLHPLTATVPKPILPIGHVPMITRLVDRLAAGGVDTVVLALGFKPEPFLAEFPDGRCGDVALVYAVEPEPLDTAGAIAFAATAAGVGDTFVVANGDIVTDLDVGRLVADHREHGAEATIHLVPIGDPSVYGVADLADDGRIVRFVEKPPPGTEPSNLVNAGTYVFEPSVLDLVEPGVPVSVERVTFPFLAGGDRLRAFVSDDYWIDAGRPGTYRQANVDLVTGARAALRVEPVHGRARVGSGVHVVDSVIGADSVVGDGSGIERSVVLPGARIGARARLVDSIVMGVVGDDASLDDVVVGVDGEVADGENVEHTTRPLVVGVR